MFKLDDLVLLEKYDFLGKNRKLSDIYKGPYIVVKFNSNNTLVVKTRAGSKEYIYNTMLLKLYKEAPKTQKETGKPKSVIPPDQKSSEEEIPKENIKRKI